MNVAIKNTVIKEYENLAIQLANEAGSILANHFNTPLQIDYKDKHERDPVTIADSTAQRHIATTIANRYPAHGFIGEEDTVANNSIAPDIVWVVDPLDGTKNFLNGIPMFACSIGVLYKGIPLLGAIYLPWLGLETDTVLHASRGNGAYIGNTRISVSKEPKPNGSRLYSSPKRLHGSMLRTNPLDIKKWEIRCIGSTVYELAMAAKGSLQFSSVRHPRIWDVAAGSAIILEAGGKVLVNSRSKKWLDFIPFQSKWESLESFFPSWQSNKTRMDEIRNWSRPVIVDNT